MPEYKLTYFNARGRAELIRLIFCASGTKFIDNRIEGKDWPALKQTIPHGTLPTLEVDGKMYGQSLAIARYVARITNLAGKSRVEEFKADEMVDTVSDFGESVAKVMFEKDEDRKAELQKELAPTAQNYVERMKKLLKSNGGNFFVGTSLTWADLAVYNSLEMALQVIPTVLDKFADLKAFTKRIDNLPTVSAYLKTRPKTDH